MWYVLTNMGSQSFEFRAHTLSLTARVFLSYFRSTAAACTWASGERRLVAATVARAAAFGWCRYAVAIVANEFWHASRAGA